MTAAAPIAPRLLDETEAAAYVGVPLKAFRRDPIGRVVVCGRVRFDRFAIDAHLDNLSGLKPDLRPSVVEDDPEAALARFLAGPRKDAARQS
jgi:hypothetical protein